jgi:hypothetical protein
VDGDEKDWATEANVRSRDEAMGSYISVRGESVITYSDGPFELARSREFLDRTYGPSKATMTDKEVIEAYLNGSNLRQTISELDDYETVIVLAYVKRLIKSRPARGGRTVAPKKHVGFPRGD